MLRDRFKPLPSLGGFFLPEVDRRGQTKTTDSGGYDGDGANLVRALHHEGTRQFVVNGVDMYNIAATSLLPGPDRQCDV